MLENLLGKASEWIRNANASLVLAAKLYGYVQSHAPGMLVFLVNEAHGVHEIYQPGAIPDDDGLALLNAYNTADG